MDLYSCVGDICDEVTGLPLLHVYEPAFSKETLYFSEDTKKGVESIIWDNKYNDVLSDHHIDAKTKVYLYGVNGIGKTHASEVIAYELKRRMVVVNWEPDLFSSMRIRSGNYENGLDNISKVMLFISNTLRDDLVVVFRNFDADPLAMSYLLGAIDRYVGNDILIVQNAGKIGISEYLLDTFDELIHFEPPDAECRHDILYLYLLLMKTRDLDIEHMIDSTDGWTPKEIKDMCFEAYRNSIIKGRKTVGRNEMDYAWGRITDRRRARLGGDGSTIELAGLLDDDDLQNGDDFENEDDR